MRDRLEQAGRIMVYILFIMLYMAMAFMPEPQEMDYVRQQIKEEQMIQ